MHSPYQSALVGSLIRLITDLLCLGFGNLLLEIFAALSCPSVPLDSDEMKKCDVLGALSLAALASATKLLSSGPSGSVSYQIGNATYFSGFESLAEVAVTNPTLNITPLSVLKTNASSISGDWIKAALASYVEKDDVYSASFYTQARSAIAIVYTGEFLIVAF